MAHWWVLINCSVWPPQIFGKTGVQTSGDLLVIWCRFQATEKLEKRRRLLFLGRGHPFEGRVSKKGVFNFWWVDRSWIFFQGLVGVKPFILFYRGCFFFPRAYPVDNILFLGKRRVCCILIVSIRGQTILTKTYCTFSLPTCCVLWGYNSSSSSHPILSLTPLLGLVTFCSVCWPDVLSHIYLYCMRWCLYCMFVPEVQHATHHAHFECIWSLAKLKNVHSVVLFLCILNL